MLSSLSMLRTITLPALRAARTAIFNIGCMVCIPGGRALKKATKHSRVARDYECQCPWRVAAWLVFLVLAAVFFSQLFPFPGGHLFILAVLALHRLALVRWQLQVLTRALAQFLLLRGAKT